MMIATLLISAALGQAPSAQLKSDSDLFSKLGTVIRSLQERDGLSRDLERQLAAMRENVAFMRTVQMKQRVELPADFRDHLRSHVESLEKLRSPEDGEITVHGIHQDLAIKADSVKAASEGVRFEPVKPSEFEDTPLAEKHRWTRPNGGPRFVSFDFALHDKGLATTGLQMKTSHPQQGGTVYLWNRSARIPFVVSSEQPWFSAVAVAPDGEHLVGGASDGDLQLWRLDMPAGGSNPDEGPPIVEAVGEIGDYESPVNFIEFVPTNPKLVLAASDYTTKLFDLTRQKQLYSFADHEHPDRKHPITAVRVAPDGESFLLARRGHPTEMREIETGKVLFQFDRPHVLDVAFLGGDSNQFATCSIDGAVELWHARKGTLHEQFMQPDIRARSIAAVGDGAHLALAGLRRKGRGGKLSILNLKTKRITDSFEYDATIVQVRINRAGDAMALLDVQGFLTFLRWGWGNPFAPFEVAASIPRAIQGERYTIEYFHGKRRATFGAVTVNQTASQSMSAGSYVMWAEDGKKTYDEDKYAVSRRNPRLFIRLNVLKSP